MGTRLYIQALFIDHLLQSCADVDDLAVATRRQELYIIAMETDQTLRYHICIESQCLSLCTYFCNILSCMGLKVIPTSVSTLWSSHLVCTTPPSPPSQCMHSSCTSLLIFYCCFGLYLCFMSYYSFQCNIFIILLIFCYVYLYVKPTTIKFDVYSFQ